MSEPYSSGATTAYHRVDEGSMTAPMIVYGLFLVTILTGGLSAILGVIIAYASRASAGPAAQSHFTFQIRSFWLHLLIFPFALLLILLGVPLLLIGVGLVMIIVGGLMLSLAHLWYLVRCVVGLLHAARGDGYPRPTAWLI